MSRARLWTVARFPNGTWTTGGGADDPDYAECEIFQVKAFTRGAAKRMAQGRRYRESKRGLKP